MSIEYLLYLDTATPLMEIRAALRRCMAGSREHPASESGPPSLFQSGVLATASTPDQTAQQFIEEEFGLHATASIMFGLDKLALGPAQDAVLRYTSDILGAVAGDAALLYNAEHLVLRRSSGSITLRDDFWPWTRDRLTHFALPYRLGPLA